MSSKVLDRIRAEAIETCERLFRDSKKRVTTENIGLGPFKLERWEQGSS